MTAKINIGAARARTAITRACSDIATAIRAFETRGWLVSIAAAAGTLLLIGTVAAIFDNPYFTRMTAVREQDYVIWAATALLVGLIAGTFAAANVPGHAGKLMAGGVFADLAVGCPVCNKVVVLLIGTSGALTFFDPLQLWIGLGSLVLLGWTLLLRARAISGECSLTMVQVAQLMNDQR